MPTGYQLLEDKKWLAEQEAQMPDLALVDQPIAQIINKPGAKATWYKPDGTAIPNLPCDFYHRQRYIARGWSLAPPVHAKVYTPQPVPTPNTAVPDPAPPAVVAPAPVSRPPKHFHVMREEIGSPCLVAGCTAVRKHPSKGKRAAGKKEQKNA